MTIKTTHLDVTKYIETVEDQIELFDEALATGDPRVIVGTVGTIARARGMTDLARVTGIERDLLYRALADDADPAMETVVKVLEALKLEQRARAGTSSPDAGGARLDGGGTIRE